MSEVNDFLAHYGVKGMKWGVRRDRPEGVSARTNREARKDAKEFTQAKMFYGEGAGTRRKLIKASVNAKSEKDPSYKKAFDHHVNNTDMGKRATQAQRERKKKDTSKAVRKHTRGTVNILNGNSQAASATTAFVVGGALYAHKTGVDKVVFDMAKKTVKDARTAYSQNQDAKIVNDLLKRAGFNT